MNLKYLVIMLINSLFAVTGQMLLKTGMNEVQVLSIRTFLNIKILLGLCVYVIATLIWLYILSKVNYSVAYPISSVGYIFTVIFSYFFLGESITITKIFGTLIIIIGIVVLVQ